MRILPVMDRMKWILQMIRMILKDDPVTRAESGDGIRADHIDVDLHYLVECTGS